MALISHKTFFTVTVSLLCIASTLALRILYRFRSHLFTHKHVQLPDLVLAHVLLLLPSLETCLNFLPRDATALANDGVLHGSTTWCTISAFSSVASLTARVGGGATLAYFTYRSCASPSVRKTEFRAHIIKATLISWTCGFLVSSGYAIGGLLGPYRGIFCVVERLDLVSTSLLTAVLYFGVITFMCFFFRKAILALRTITSARLGVRRNLGQAADHPIATTTSDPHLHAALGGLAGRDARRLTLSSPVEGPRSFTTDTAGSRASSSISLSTRVHTSASLTLTRTGVLLVSSFALCWSIITIASAAEFFGVSVSDDIFMISVWALKLQPIIDFLIVDHELSKHLKPLAAIQPT